MSEYPFHYDPPKTAPRSASEIAIQASCKQAVEIQFKARFVAIPNGTYIASKASRGKVRQEGLSKGFPDAIIVGLGPNAGKVAFPEFKAKSQLRPEQHEALSTLSANGHDCGVFRSPETLLSKMREWGWQ